MDLSRAQYVAFGGSAVAIHFATGVRIFLDLESSLDSCSPCGDNANRPLAPRADRLGEPKHAALLGKFDESMRVPLSNFVLRVK